MNHALLDLVDEAFDKKSWHGPNLRGSLRGVTTEQAAWRPGPDRHNIWELTLHAAYWKYVVRRRLTGAKRGSFELPGSNFFLRPCEETSETAWRADIDILVAEHRKLRAVIAKLAAPTLRASPPDSRHCRARSLSCWANPPAAAPLSDCGLSNSPEREN